MIPERFKSTYPHLVAALTAMKSTGPPYQAPSGIAETVTHELADASERGEALSAVLIGLFDPAPEPNDEFMRFSMAAYRELGISREITQLIETFWAEAAEAWSTAQRGEFLLLLVRDRTEVFQALDFAVEVFRRVKFTADQVFPWIVAAHKLVGNDLYQEGFWRCVERFCASNATEAVAVAERWLNTGPDGSSLP